MKLTNLFGVIIFGFLGGISAAIAAEAWTAPEFRVIVDPADVPRIGALRISCFDESNVEVVRFLQLDPQFSTLPDGRPAYSWTRPPAEWTDGVYSCSASIGKSEADVPIPSAPVDVIIDIPLSAPVLEVVQDTPLQQPELEVLAAICVEPDTLLGPVSEGHFEFNGQVCWDRSIPAPVPYTQRYNGVQIAGT